MLIILVADDEAHIVDLVRATLEDDRVRVGKWRSSLAIQHLASADDRSL
jgi:hypothetical protein